MQVNLNNFLEQVKTMCSLLDSETSTLFVGRLISLIQDQEDELATKVYHLAESFFSQSYFFNIEDIIQLNQCIANLSKDEKNQLIEYFNQLNPDNNTNKNVDISNNNLEFEIELENNSIKLSPKKRKIEDSDESDTDSEIQVKKIKQSPTWIGFYNLLIEFIKNNNSLKLEKLIKSGFEEFEGVHQTKEVEEAFYNNLIHELDHNEMNLLYHAVSAGNIEILDILKNYGACFNFSPRGKYQGLISYLIAGCPQHDENKKFEILSYLLSNKCIPYYNEDAGFIFQVIIDRQDAHVLKNFIQVGGLIGLEDEYFLPNQHQLFKSLTKDTIALTFGSKLMIEESIWDIKVLKNFISILSEDKCKNFLINSFFQVKAALQRCQVESLRNELLHVLVFIGTKLCEIPSIKDDQLKDSLLSLSIYKEYNDNTDISFINACFKEHIDIPIAWLQDDPGLDLVQSLLKTC